MVLFLKLLGKRLTQESNEDGGSIRWAPALSFSSNSVRGLISYYFAYRWFKEDINPYTGQLDWLFTNTYWNRNWASCPDIFLDKSKEEVTSGSWGVVPSPNSTAHSSCISLSFPAGCDVTLLRFLCLAKDYECVNLKYLKPAFFTFQARSPRTLWRFPYKDGKI